MANEFVSFNPYDEQLEALRQRQRIADMLRQQSMEPLESRVAPGGYVVPISPFQGLAKMLQAYGAARWQRGIDKEMSELRDRAAYDTRQQQAEQTAALKGIVGRLTGQRDEVGPMEQAVLGAPMPPKPITVTPQMDRAGQILSGKDEELAEFEPTAQYRYDPKDAQQMVMTSPAFDPSTRGQMLAAALKQTMEKPEAEEFGTTPVLGADGKYYLVSKRGRMVEAGVSGPKNEPTADNVNWQRFTRPIGSGQNQDFVFNPRTREERPLGKPYFADPSKGADARAMTEGQAKAATFADRIAKSLPYLNVVAPGLMASAMRGVPLGNVALTPQEQVFFQAERDFINAVLRRESGATITDIEFENARQQYIPQPNDSLAVLERKRENREIVLRGLSREAGESYKPIILNQPTSSSNNSEIIDLPPRK